MKELVFSEMTLEQKLGFVCVVALFNNSSKEDEEYALELIRNRSLGAIWIQWDEKNAAFLSERLARIRATADYPILIMTDSESGMDEYKIGHHNALARVGTEERAYLFGKALGVTARNHGYNTVCCPLLDVYENGSSRSFGSDKHRVAKLAAAEARGMHCAGLLTVGKHYPSSKTDIDIDAHMVEGVSSQTKEELLAQSLYPYLALMKEDLLDGIMVSHDVLCKIDPSRPACISKPVVDVIREQGFDGFHVTDALCMMGVRARFGRVDPMGMAVEAGNDLAMMYAKGIKEQHEAVRDCYERGILSDNALNAAVNRILKAQHKVLLYENDRCTSITEEEDRLVRDIDSDGVCACLDDGLPLSISREGRHYFAVMVNNETSVDKGEVAVDTFSGHWHNPAKISEKIKALFPNATIQFFHQFPTQQQCYAVLNNSLGYDEVVLVTYSEFVAYTGMEHFTHRVVSLAEAMQHTNRISTLVHFGNQVIVGELPHFPRRILAGTSAKSTMAGIEVLAGEREAKGCFTYKVSYR